MNRLLHLLFMLLSAAPILSQAQTAKGATLENTAASSPSGISRAVVVGISKYAEVRPELQYADRDAQEFADYLQSKSGGQIPAANIKLLTNENATTANIIVALEWLKQQTQSGDRAIIYFSGHGDVETLTESQNGYLLTYNTPKQVYIAGALPVSIVKDYITTLSNKNANVLLVSDACHSGKLAGGEQGVRSANAALLNKWNKEIKILSAQPDQLSLESKDWGKGRGVFSYYLVNGLYGLADNDNNGKITISELEAYVNSNVVKDSKQTQEPVFEGPSKYTTELGIADPGEKAKTLAAVNSNALTAYNPPSGKGSMETLVNALTTEQQEAYRQFEKAMKEDRLLLPLKNSAEFYLETLKHATDNNQAVYMAEQNFTASLLNEVQVLLNKYLEGKKFVHRADFALGYQKISAALKHVEKDHPLYHSLQAQSLFFQAASLVDMWNDTVVSKKEMQIAINLLDSAKHILPDAAYIYQIQGEMYYLSGNLKKATENWEKASLLSPKWIYPLYSLGGLYYHKGNKDKAKDYLERSISIDSTMHTLECTKCAFSLLGDIYADQKKYDKAVQKYNMAISLDSSQTQFFFNASWALTNMKRYADAEKYAEALLRIDSAEAYAAYGAVALAQKKYDKAQEYAELAMDLSPDYAAAYQLMGEAMDKDGDQDGAAEYYNKAVQADPDETSNYQWLIEYWADNDMGDSIDMMRRVLLPLIKDKDSKAEVYLTLGYYYSEVNKNKAVALQCARGALELGYVNRTAYNTCFKSLKNDADYKKLMDEFPEE
ncbi:MAG: caspase family protein [Chitinophagales bacterium]